MSDTHDMPDELRAQLAYNKGPANSYSARDLVLAYLANTKEPAATNDLIIYVYQVNKQVMKRTYLYQMLYKMRTAGLVKPGTFAESVKKFIATSEGKMEARPFIKPEVEKHGTG